MTFRMFASRESLASYLGKGLTVLAAALALFTFSLPLFSQASQSAIQGAVYDQTHAVIAGATVTVVDVARGAQRDLTTDGAGQYGANDLIPGKYTVRAAAKGFQTLEQANVSLEVGQTVRVDLTLMPGEQTQTITVSSEAPAVDTTDAQFGGTVNNDLVNSLPLNGRNFQRLVQLHPGVVTLAGNGTGTGQVTNGRRTGDDLYRIEGITTFAQSANLTGVLNGSYRSGDSSSLLPIDAIQEFDTVQNPKAQEGWKEGSTISIGVKSGTNTIHGSAYAFGRDTLATDAPNYFTGRVTPATLEQFGATAGGRIIKDKLFWFAGYEGLRDVLGDTTLDTIPSDITLANIKGNGPNGDPKNSMVDACLSVETNGFTAAANPALINTLSARLAGVNTANCSIGLAPAVENLFPNNPTSSQSFNPPLTTLGPLNNGVFKADFIPGPHHHVSATYFTSKADQHVNQTAGELLPQWELDLADEVQMYTGSWTWAPNSAWVNDFRLGTAYFNNSTLLGDRNMLPSALYPGGYSFPTGVTNPAFGGLPEITFSNFTGVLGSGTRGPSTRGPEGNIDLVDNVSYLRGKHAFKFGFEYVDIIFDGNPTDQAEGMIKFKQLTDFLQGHTNGGTIIIGNPQTNIRARWYGGFFQDDWRLTSKVTLNAGLRYEYYGPPEERNNYLGNFNPNVTGATSPIQQVSSNTPLYNPDKADFSPRLGVAWDVNGSGKTVVRGAVSLMTDFQNMQSTVGSAPFGANIPDIGLNNSGTVANLHSPEMPGFSAAQLNAGWNTNGPVFPVSGTVTVQANGAGPFVNYSGITCVSPTDVVSAGAASQCTIAAVATHLPQPRAVEWSLDIERAITNNMTLDAAYVGNHGYDEEFSVDLNQPAVGAGWTAAVVNTCITTFVCSPNAATEVGQYSSQFPYINYINQIQSGAVSDYDALQVILNERVSHGLSFLAGYTYSHSLDDAGSLPSVPSNLRLNYASGSADIRNRFTISPSYLVPGIKVPGQMLEGWSVSSLIVLQGGQPWFPTDSTTDDLLGTGENNNGSPIQTWNFQGPKSAFTAGPTPFPCYGPLGGCTSFAKTPAAIMAECASAAVAPYAPGSTNAQLATAAFMNFGCYVANGGTLVPGGGILTPPAFGTIGDASRNIFRGPNYYNVDLSIGKIWKFKERYSAQFRAEFFNLFNRADFIGVPGQTNPAKGFGGQFGCSCSTPDSSTLNPNPVLGSGGPRHIQFGLKLQF